MSFEDHEANHIGSGSLGLPEELGKRSRQGTAQLCLLRRPRPCAMLVPGVMAGLGVREQEGDLSTNSGLDLNPSLALQFAGLAVDGGDGGGETLLPQGTSGKRGSSG